MVVEPHWKVIEARRRFDDADVLDDPIIMFDYNLQPYFRLLMCSFLVPTLVPCYMWGESYVHSFLVAGCLCYFFVLHGSCLVNSAAHLYGSRPYNKGINPSENKYVAVLAMGEGWHNWHHTFPYDYAASELGVCNQFNPTKLFIDACAYVGLVSERKRALNAWKNIK